MLDKGCIPLYSLSRDGNLQIVYVELVSDFYMDTVWQ